MTTTPQHPSQSQKLDDIIEKLEKTDKSPWLAWGQIIVPSTIAAVAIVVGFIQYVSTSSLSARQPYLEKQTDLCVKASEHAARLATSRDDVQWKKSLDDFQMLYFGPLVVVEEAGSKSQVAQKMIAFEFELIKIDVPPKSLPLANHDLNLASLTLANACRDLLASKWRVGILGWFGY